MRNKPEKDIDAIMKDGKLVDAALAAGVREALIRHIKAGEPVVEWKDGKTVWLPPEEIKKRIEEMDNKSG
ncbi:MAG: hypothetical protein E3J72_15205 [Planctomycetota bacterium]|nr:MAG: hypothetical protein E3J72_15205 [Planctomycetota bacterium]